MKKILFATTALVATASVAAADVTFSGYGRFGVKYTGSLAQSAANAAAIAEQEARLMASIGVAGEITVGDLLSNVGAGFVGDEDALAADDVVTDAFTTTASAFEYAAATRAAAIARQEALITVAKTLTATSTAKNVVYDPETGEAAALTDAEVAALTAAPAAGNIITLADAATAPNIATALEAARTTAQVLAEAEAEIAAAFADQPATIATDAIVSDMMVTSRLRLNIDASAESDSGITFGARIRIQQGEGEEGTANAARFYAKTGGLEVGVGNIYGALEWMAGQYPIDLGLTGLGYEYTAYGVGGADAYSSGGTGASGRNGVEVMYSAGDFSAHISASDAADAASSDRVAANVAYTMSDWTVALGMQDSDAATDVDWTATVGGKIGGVSLGLGYAETNAGVDRTVMTVGMDVGAATNVEAYIADQSDRPDTGYGVDFNHSLGGGTSLRGGVASLTTGQTIADFGVRFNF